jgi:urease accessory protein
MGTMLVAAPAIDDAWLAVARAATPREGEAAATRLPGVLLARYRGHSGEAAREHFAAIWRELREPVMGRSAIEPRIWRT